MKTAKDAVVLSLVCVAVGVFRGFSAVEIGLLVAATLIFGFALGFIKIPPKGGGSH